MSQNNLAEHHSIKTPSSLPAWLSGISKEVDRSKCFNDSARFFLTAVLAQVDLLPDACARDRFHTSSFLLLLVRHLFLVAMHLFLVASCYY